MKKTEPESSQEILEQGHIYFLYRPKVRPDSEDAGDEEAVAAEDLGDVQNFYLVLRPQGGRFRLFNIGRKRLPDIDGHERNWGFVDMIAESGTAIEEALQRDTYETKTRGERVRPAARPAGEGVYALVREGGRTISPGRSSCRKRLARCRRRSISRRRRASPSRSPTQTKGAGRAPRN